VEYAGGGITSALNSAGATTTVAVPLLNPTPVGQPMVIAVVSDATSGSWTTPAGWSVLQASAIILTDMVMAAYFKYSAGTEGASVTVTGPSGHMVGASASLKGASSSAMQANIGQAIGSVNTTGPTSGGTLNPAVRGNGLAVRICICSSQNTAANGTLTPPAGGWTTRQSFINSTGSAAFCTGICISTQLGSAPAAAPSANASGGSAWEVIDAWFIDGARPKYPPLPPLVSRMRANNW
jgi:hypothetical protein